MQDFLCTNCSTKELIFLNNCRLYLQVTTLAEITNHNGTHLLETNITTSNHTPNLNTVSTSLYNWPTQPNPGKPAWQLWTQTLQALYTKPGMATQLQHTLGPWTPEAAESQRWYVHYNPATKEIHTAIPSQAPNTYTPTSTTQLHLYYQQMPSNQRQSSISFLAMIKTQRNGFWVTKIFI